MAYETLVAGNVITATWANASVRDQVVSPFASAAARSSAVSSPVQGMYSYQTDAKYYPGYDGVDWVPVGRFTVYARKTANEVVNNSTTLQNDDHLVWAGAANGVYDLDLRLHFNSPTTADLKIGWTVPAGASMLWGGLGISTAGALEVPSNLTEASVQPIGGTGAAVTVRFWGTVTLAGTAGNIQLQWAQNAAVASDTTLYAGSLGRMVRVA